MYLHVFSCILMFSYVFFAAGTGAEAAAGEASDAEEEEEDADDIGDDALRNNGPHQNKKKVLFCL